jgi:hypothetical protein
LIREDRITRRSFVKTVAGGLAATPLPLRAAAKNVGIGTYSYHNLSMDEMVVRLNALRVREIEMSRGEFMLMNRPTEELFRSARTKLDRAGIRCGVLLHSNHQRRSGFRKRCAVCQAAGQQQCHTSPAAIKESRASATKFMSRPTKAPISSLVKSVRGCLNKKTRRSRSQPFRITEVRASNRLISSGSWRLLDGEEIILSGAAS